MSDSNNELIELTNETISSMIYEIRGQKVMLDFDLARIYGYSTRDFNNQIKRNLERFDSDFRFQLSDEERRTILRCKKSTANPLSSKRRYNPYAFTEQGIYMLMTVLKGELAVKQSKVLIRLFKQMKDYIATSNNLLNANEILKLSHQVSNNTSRLDIIEDKLGIVMDGFVDFSKLSHILIMDGERIESDLAYQSIYKQATSSIIVIDDYIDIKTLQLLKTASSNVEVTIFTDNKGKNSVTKQFVDDFVLDTGINIVFKRNNGRFHDRYIFIDYNHENETIYHCGTSSKDSGNKITTIMKIDVKEPYHQIISDILHNSLLSF